MDAGLTWFKSVILVIYDDPAHHASGFQSEPDLVSFCYLDRITENHLSLIFSKNYRGSEPEELECDF